MNQLAHASFLSNRNDALSMFQAGVNAADPFLAVKHYLAVEGNRLTLRLNAATPSAQRSGTWSRIHLIAIGKAASLMAKAATEIIPDRLLSGLGIAVTNYENVSPIPGIEIFGAGHPLPDAAGLEAARRVAERASAAQQDELVLVLLSGGGSALIPCPVAGISLAAKSETTGLLLASGATIQQINCVRKHLSRLKGGGLARMIFPADCHALILSDVLDDDLSVIASGPTVPDPTTFADAMTVLKDKQLWNRIPKTVQHHLEQGGEGLATETPKPGDPIFANTDWTLIGSNRLSLDATRKAALALGYDVIVYSDNLCGIAKNVAEDLVIAANRHLEQNLAKAPLEKPIALLAGGETTVIVKGSGRGGRNQEMALAFALAAEKHQLPGPWIFLSGGTDGRDGPTDAAGGIVDSNSLQRIRSGGINPVECLTNNDSHHALEVSGDLLYTGATGTNVADLQVLLIHFQH